MKTQLQLNPLWFWCRAVLEVMWGKMTDDVTETVHPSGSLSFLNVLTHVPIYIMNSTHILISWHDMNTNILFVHNSKSFCYLFILGEVLRWIMASICVSCYLLSIQSDQCREEHIKWGPGLLWGADGEKETGRKQHTQPDPPDPQEVLPAQRRGPGSPGEPGESNKCVWFHREVINPSTLSNLTSQKI